MVENIQIEWNVDKLAWNQITNMSVVILDNQFIWKFVIYV
jgi:hypothetical protein